MVPSRGTVRKLQEKHHDIKRVQQKFQSEETCAPGTALLLVRIFKIEFQLL